MIYACENSSIYQSETGDLSLYFPNFDHVFHTGFHSYMKVYHSIEQFKGAKNPVVTIGTFDGVHAGHQEIIKQVKELARSMHGESVILTFSPHPRMVLFPDDDDLKLLHTDPEKQHRLDSMGIDHLIIHPFTKKFSRIPYTEYVRDILVNKLKVKKLVIGFNHQFGRNREGTFQKLKSLSAVYGFELERIPAKTLNKAEISSTKIRKALNVGDVATANKYLGYEYEISGKVIKGKGLGKGLGFPTANIQIEDKNKLIPAKGVYAVRAETEGKMYGGMLNIGTNPTVGGQTLSIEVNIFGFDKDIYGEQIRILFVQRIRDEKKFDGLEALTKAIAGDKEKAMKILNA